MPKQPPAAHDHGITTTAITIMVRMITIMTTIAATTTATRIRMITDTDASVSHGCGGAVSADDVAVAGLPGRRVLLFQRHRMGRRGRRHHGRRVAARLAGGDARDGSGFCDAIFLAQAYRAASAWTRSALREIAELAARLRAVARAPSRDDVARSRASSISLARPGTATILSLQLRPAMGRSSIRSRSAHGARRMACR